MIKPAAMQLSCPNCGWKNRFQPRSDALLGQELPQQCPQCGNPHLHSATIPSISESLTQLLGQVRGKRP